MVSHVWTQCTTGMNEVKHKTFLSFILNWVRTPTMVEACQSLVRLVLVLLSDFTTSNLNPIYDITTRMRMNFVTYIYFTSSNHFISVISVFTNGFDTSRDFYFLLSRLLVSLSWCMSPPALNDDMKIILNISEVAMYLIQITFSLDAWVRGIYSVVAC